MRKNLTSHSWIFCLLSLRTCRNLRRWRPFLIQWNWNLRSLLWYWGKSGFRYFSEHSWIGLVWAQESDIKNLVGAELRFVVALIVMVIDAWNSNVAISRNASFFNNPQISLTLTLFEWEGSKKFWCLSTMVSTLSCTSPSYDFIVNNIEICY